MTLLRSVLCWFGFHRWSQPGEHSVYKGCKWCGERTYNV